MPRRRDVIAASRVGSQVEALLGRALGSTPGGSDDSDAPAPRRHGRSTRRTSPPSSRKRARAGVAFVALLAAASLYFYAHARRGAPAVSSNAPATSSSLPASASDTNTDRLRAMVAGSDACSDVVASTPTIHCTLDRAEVEYRLVGAGAVIDSYRAGAGPIPGGDRRGPARCAAGLAEERAWSRIGAPKLAVGRYRCALVGGRADMWWTEQDRGLIAHAHASDDDLGGLFAWWQAQADH
jgi:hypothetical protein